MGFYSTSFVRIYREMIKKRDSYFNVILRRDKF